MWVFAHKRDYNSACIGDVPDSCIKVEVFEVGQFHGVTQICPTDTFCHGSEKLTIWTQNWL